MAYFLQLSKPRTEKIIFDFLIFFFIFFLSHVIFCDQAEKIMDR